MLASGLGTKMHCFSLEKRNITRLFFFYQCRKRKNLKLWKNAWIKTLKHLLHGFQTIFDHRNRISTREKWNIVPPTSTKCPPNNRPIFFVCLCILSGNRPSNPLTFSYFNDHQQKNLNSNRKQTNIAFQFLKIVPEKPLLTL